MPGTVIIGAGQAGFQCAASLRTEGYQESITLIGDEPGLPYQRPPLSKAFMLGKQDEDGINLRPECFYTDHHIELINDRAESISQTGSRITLASGTQIAYTNLVLATGAGNRKLNIDGHYLRTREEASTLRARLDSADTITIIGGGFIGLELAAIASTLNKQVTVVEACDRLMARVVAPEISSFYRDLHHHHGVSLIFSAPGKNIPADLTIIGVGVLPNSELAAAAGLETNDGIIVNSHLQTNNPNIYAIGDCARHPNPFTNELTRIESVQNAVDQARTVAAAIAGQPHPYKAVPWFWTDQYDIKLQMAGLSRHYDTAITRGDPASKKFSVLYFKNNRFIAIDSINKPGDHMAGRKLLAAATALTPQQASDLSTDLKALSAN